MSDVVGRGTIELVGDARKLRASIEEAKKSIRTLGEGQKDISKGAAASIDKYIGRLEAQNQTINKSKRETELFNLALKGASNEQLKAADAALKVAESHARWNTIGANAEKVFLAVASAAATAAAAMALTVKSNIDFADHLKDLSQSTGIAVEQLAGLSLLAKQNGTDVEGFAKAVNHMSVEMGKAPEKFRALGVSATDPVEALKQFADIFNQIPDIQTRNALAQAVFKKSWQELAPILTLGGREIGNVVEKGTRLSGITREVAERADEFNDKLEELKISSQAFGLEFLPTLTSIVKQLLAAKEAATGFHDAVKNFFSIGGDQAAKPEQAIADIDTKLAKLSQDASTFAQMGLMKRIFSADDVAIVNYQIAQLLKQRAMLEKLLPETGPKPEPPKPNAATGARARAFLATDDGTARQQAAAQLALDIDLIRKNSAATIAAYADAEKVIQARRAANLLDDQEYYAAKAGFIRLNAQEQERAFNEEIARLQRETFSGKTAQADRLENEKKIVDARAALARSRAGAIVDLTVNDIQARAAIDRLAQSYTDAKVAADAYIESIDRRNRLELAAIGHGNKYREYLEGRSQIEEKFIEKRQSLERDRRNVSITQETFDIYLNTARDAYQREVALYDQRSAAILAAERDWVNGASEALSNYADEAKNVAKQTEEAFTHAFKNLEDALVTLVTKGKLDFKSLADSIVADIARMWIKENITGPAAQGLKDLIKASGIGKAATDVAGKAATDAAGKVATDAAGKATAEAGAVAANTALTTLGATVAATDASIATFGATLVTSEASTAAVDASLIAMDLSVVAVDASLVALAAAATEAAAALAALAASSATSSAASSGGSGLSSILALFKGGGSTSSMAAAAGNSGAAEGAALGAFALGTDYVPRTGLYRLHQGEAVLTAAENQGGRGMSLVIHQTFAPGTDRRTVNQAALSAGRAVAMAGRRNG